MGPCGIQENIGMIIATRGLEESPVGRPSGIIIWLVQPTHPPDHMDFKQLMTLL